MKSYLDEDGRLEVIEDSVLDKICDIQNDIHYSKWKASDGRLITDDEEPNEYLMHPGGSLEERYQVYCDMALQCNEEPVPFDEWLNG